MGQKAGDAIAGYMAHGCMKPKTALILAILSGAVAWGAVSPDTAQAAIRYTIVDLGTLGGMFSIGEDVNASGHVTGQSNTTSQAFVPLRAFLYDGSMQGLGTLPGHSLSYGYSINDAGHVAGRSYNTSPGGERAFFYDGALHDLGTLGGSASQARGINNSDQVTGSSLVAGDNEFHAFLHDGTMMHDLGTLGTSSFGRDINDIGHVVGFNDDVTIMVTRGFFYDGTMHELATLGGTHSYAHAINNAGQITGGAWTSAEHEHAYLYDGTMHDLDTLGGTTSAGYGINDLGSVVGQSQTAAGGFNHAFFYDSAGGMIDLNTQIDPLLGWELLEARDINNAGQITGLGIIGGQRHAFLLTPVAEPFSAALAGFALLGLFARRFYDREC
jgi:probable HAF family extracellular repeat protein